MYPPYSPFTIYTIFSAISPILLILILSNWSCALKSRLPLCNMMHEDVPSTHTESLATLDRHTDLWYPDGNLIIRAGPQLFRVFRGILSKQSAIFAEILPALELSTHDVLEGCPVLQLPHSAPEVADFLRAIFDAGWFYSKRELPFEAIAAVLRFSSRYQIPTLRRQALVRLSAIYPTSLVAFSTSGLNASYFRGQLLAAVHLAREHNINWILPVTLYGFCLQMDGRALTEGVDYGGARLKLSLADQATCIDAAVALRNANADEILTWYRTQRLPDDGCTGGEECRTSRFMEGGHLLDEMLSVPDVTVRWTTDTDSELCQPCKVAMRSWDLKRKYSLWNSFPEMFGQQEWTLLERERAVALAVPESESDEISF